MPYSVRSEICWPARIQSPPLPATPHLSLVVPHPPKTTLMASTTATMPETAPTTTPTPPPRSILSPPRPSSAGKVKKHGRFASVSALPTLRAMYQRAARAFLQRNTTETQYLIDAAFQIITPPQTAAADHLSSQRKKWDILRITLETTLYTSPPAATPQPPTKGVPGLSQDLVRSASPSLNNNLRSNLLLSPPSLLATLHTRSLQLFTPLSEKPSSAFLPAQILVSLVLASLKLDCAHVGRGMVEDWLARRPPPETEAPGPGVDEGYAKVVDVYCLHVLPRLGEWEYAKEFLSYEIELPVERRSVSAAKSLFGGRRSFDAVHYSISPRPSPGFMPNHKSHLLHRHRIVRKPSTAPHLPQRI